MPELHLQEGKGGQDQPSHMLWTARLRAAAGRFDSDLFGPVDPTPSRLHELGAVLNEFVR